MGDLSFGEEAGSPLRVGSDTTSMGAKGLGTGSGSVGEVEPAVLGGLDKERAEGRGPLGTPRALEKEFPC